MTNKMSKIKLYHQQSEYVIDFLLFLITLSFLLSKVINVSTFTTMFDAIQD